MTEKVNFLPDQYKSTETLPINHCYLPEQFADHDEILAKIKQLVIRGDYTLGEEVDKFEKRYAKLIGTKYALGVGSGTDAIMLSLKALGIGPGDEVITTAYTFYATVGAIVTTGATPVFADAKLDDYNIDPESIRKVITDKTKAIVPVHWSGCACDMDALNAIAKEHNLSIVEDACHGIKGHYKGRPIGGLGDLGCFSMHPLKNLNVWGDGGIITTNNEELYKKLSLMRNHGLINRNECAMFAYNSRLDTLQAIVANHLLDKIENITELRISHANYLDEKLKDVPQITIPKRDPESKQVYHIYVLRAENREELVQFLIANGVDAKVHYPIPMHLQPAAKEYGYKKGDFPQAELICDTVFSLPVHEFITQGDLDKMADLVRSFYA